MMDDQHFTPTQRRQLAWYADQLMGGIEIPPEPTPAPIELCARIHHELTAAWNLLGKALDAFDNPADKRDAIRHRRQLKSLIDQLESHHIPRGTRRLPRRGTRHP
jgi:hypothetical protein